MLLCFAKMKIITKQKKKPGRSLPVTDLKQQLALFTSMNGEEAKRNGVEAYVFQQFGSRAEK